MPSRSGVSAAVASSKPSSSRPPVAPGLRELLLDCFRAAVAAVDARLCTAASLAATDPAGDWHVLAIGKAAGAMALGASEVLGERLLGGLVITKPGYVPDALGAVAALHAIESAHPQPDQRSLRAGAAVIDYLAALPARSQVLFLVSGGASSLVESPVDGVALEDLQRIGAWALASGLPIGQVNAVRRMVSRLKGGGLAALAAHCRTQALFVSDVARDDPAVIGSGLLHASPGASQPWPEFPRDIADILARGARANPVVDKLPDVPYRIVASVRDACRAAAQRGRLHGLAVVPARGRFAGDAGRLGMRFARTVMDGAAGTLHVWGGESTVKLPPQPGRGGRNQQLALSAALLLDGRADTCLLAAGTDGVDGVTEDAGALVDGGTCDRGRDAGLDPARHLATASAGAFLEAAGDLVHTGPTLTNVGDVVLAVTGPTRH